MVMTSSQSGSPTEKSSSFLSFKALSLPCSFLNHTGKEREGERGEKGKGWKRVNTKMEKKETSDKS